MIHHMFFELTDSQRTKLKPLFDEVNAAHAAAEPGMALLRLDGDGLSEAIFLPNKYAKEVVEICDQLKYLEEKKA